MINIFVVQNLFQKLYQYLADKLKAEDQGYAYPNNDFVDCILLIISTLKKFEGVTGF